jgi:hypothetical protein
MGEVAVAIMAEKPGVPCIGGGGKGVGGLGWSGLLTRSVWLGPFGFWMQAMREGIKKNSERSEGRRK